LGKNGQSGIDGRADRPSTWPDPPHWLNPTTISSGDSGAANKQGLTFGILKMNLKKTKPFFLLFVLSLGLSGSPAYGQAPALKWKLKPDDQFEVRLVQSSTSKTKVDSRETLMNNSTTIVIDWKVSEVAESGDATIEQSLKSIKLLVGDPAVPSQVISYDTALPNVGSKESQELLKQVMPLIGLRFDVVMSPWGEIKAVSLPEETKDVLNQLPATMKLRALFSDQGLKDILGSSVVVLPEQEFKAGDQWTTETVTPTVFGNVKRKRTYTLVGTKTVDGREFAEFKMVASMEPDENGTEGQTKGASLNGSLISFSGTGQLMLDLDGGYFTFSEVQNRVETERPYREKMIQTEVTSRIEMSVQKK
jgi:hypothetical protein